MLLRTKVRMGRWRSSLWGCDWLRGVGRDEEIPICILNIVVVPDQNVFLMTASNEIALQALRYTMPSSSIPRISYLNTKRPVYHSSFSFKSVDTVHYISISHKQHQAIPPPHNDNHPSRPPLRRCPPLPHPHQRLPPYLEPQLVPRRRLPACPRPPQPLHLYKCKSNPPPIRPHPLLPLAHQIDAPPRR